MNIFTTLLLHRALIIGTFLFTANFLNAAIIYVDPSAVGANNGSSWANAYTNLSSALAAANNGDEVWVKQGVYKPVTQVDVNGSGGADVREATFQVPDGVALYGGFAGTELSRDERNWVVNPTILSGDIDNNDINMDGNCIAETTADIAGNNAYHVVYTQNVNAFARIDGFIITAGYANSAVVSDPNQDGGAWYNRLDGGINASSPAIENNTFIGNYAASEGGAVFCTNAAAGGAVLSLIQHCKFQNNKSNNAGGAVNIGSFSAGNYQPHFIKCEFSNNEAYRRGGAIYFTGDHAILDSCTFQNNMVTAISPDGSTLPGSGGGVAMTNSSAHFNNCIFTSNSATGNPTGAFEGGGGGAVYMSSNEPQATTLGVSEPVFISCGFYSNTAGGNTAAWGGAAVHLSDGGKLRPKYINCVFENNDAQNDGGAVANFTRVIGVAGGYVPELKPNFTNSTFTNNSANRGGAIFNDGFVFMASEVLQSAIENCILWDDAAATSGPEVFNTGGNILVAYSLIEGSGGSGGGWNVSTGTDGGNNIDAGPGFINAGDPDGADNTPGTNDDGLRVGNTSPAVDAGNNAAAGIVGIAADYAGANRVLGGEVDMGAYERAGIIIPDLDIYWLDEWRPVNPPCLSCPWAVLLADRVFPQYVWDGPAQLIDDGKTAIVTGRIVNIRERKNGFKVYIKLINKQDWKSWSSKGRTYIAITPEAIFAAFLTHKNWTFRELSGESYLEGTGDFSGKLLLSKYPLNNRTGFQLGTGANGWDKDPGLGGSFAYKGTLKYKGKEIKLSGTGSINVDACKCKRNCTPLIDPTRTVLQGAITGNGETLTNESDEGFTIFPVPAHNRLTIVPKNLANGKYASKLFSSAGQLKKQELIYINKANAVVSIDGFQPGIYILQLISSSGKMFIKKVIVE
jgi:predicted outer membrane repeat protein